MTDGPDLREAEDRIRADLELSERRMLHTEGVIKAAVEIAARHFPSLPEERVRVAALMHDFTKEYSLEKQTEICARYGIPTGEAESKKPKLLHAKTAAAIAEHEYRLPPDVCSAVRWHTTGRAKMSPLELTVYFADYIEENRAFPTCVKLRAYYERQLKKRKNGLDALLYAVAKSFDLTLTDLISDKEWIDPVTVEARNYYRRIITEGEDRFHGE